MKHTQNQEKQNVGNQNASCCVVEAGAGAHVANRSANTLDAQLDYLRCLTGVASGRVAGADDIAGVELETFELAGANRLGVPATWCCGSPNADSLSSGGYGQGVASANVLYLSQGDNCGQQGVHNFDALVENQQLWSNQQQPNSYCNQGGEGGGGPLDTVAKEKDLNQEDQIKQASYCCQNEVASGPEDHQVRHPLSFAGLSLTALEERK